MGSILKDIEEEGFFPDNDNILKKLGITSNFFYLTSLF